MIMLTIFQYINYRYLILFSNKELYGNPIEVDVPILSNVSNSTNQTYSSLNDTYYNDTTYIDNTTAIIGNLADTVINNITNAINQTAATLISNLTSTTDTLFNTTTNNNTNTTGPV